jgi:hypothetical protein
MHLTEPILNLARQSMRFRKAINERPEADALDVSRQDDLHGISRLR